MRLTGKKDSEKIEKCEFVKEPGEQGVKVRIDCRKCINPSSLDNPVCFANVLDILKGIYKLESIKLHSIIETEHFGEAIEIIIMIRDLLLEMEFAAKSAPGGKGMRTKAQCPIQNCQYMPSKLFNSFIQAYRLAIQSFYNLVRKTEEEMSSGTAADPLCQECIKESLSTISSIKRNLTDIIIALWRSAFWIFLDKKKPYLLQSEIGTDEMRIVRALKRVLDNYKRLRPSFAESWVNPIPPHNATKIHEYVIDGSLVELYSVPYRTEALYFIRPMEYDPNVIPLLHMKLIDKMKTELTKQTPEEFDLTKTEHAREYAYKFGLQHIKRIAKNEGINIEDKQIGDKTTADRLCEVLAKFTAGLGISEIFLHDPNVLDIYIDAPVEKNNVYVVIGGSLSKDLQGKYLTNVRLTDADAKGLLSRFRYESGRPFSEAMPYLECDLDEYNVRVTVVGNPLSSRGVAFALRKHSTEPWTLLKFISGKSLTPLAAGLISFLMDGQSTILVAGSRGAGKSSLLGAMMLEFPQSQRILTIEDTLELPTIEMQDLGYHVESLHVQSSLGGMGEKTADDALRLALRLGESAIVLGEVRGAKETGTLYEAMRTGTAGSAVLGTIHGNSPKAVYDRVVEDMKISAQSFAATDIVVVSGLLRPSGSLKTLRRLAVISEVCQDGDGKIYFRDLMEYDQRIDAIVPTDEFEKSERVKKIASSWGMSLDEAYENIRTRALIRKWIVDYSEAVNKPHILGAKWVVKSNNAFWDIVEKQKGKIDYRALLTSWSNWFKNEVALA
ncbi:MAG: ATPase, T2SS/T4P/T4SS family [Candidatus Thermoplasmatota archaeon]